MLRQTGLSPSALDVRHVSEDVAGVGSTDSKAERYVRLSPTVPTTIENIRDSLTSKLSKFVSLNSVEIEGLRSLSCNVRSVSAEQIIIQEGRASDHICLLVEGFACRYKMLPGGRRQVLGYLIPGDMCDAHYMVYNRPDHSLAALCNSKIAWVSIDRVAQIIASYPRLATAFACSALVEAAILREWLLNVGQRRGKQRLAHLICELHARLKVVGRVASDGSFDLPINQTTLADTVGMTVVHTNRVLQCLRQAGLITLRQRRVTILDHARLVNLVDFDENYLQLQGHKV